MIIRKKARTLLLALALLFLGLGYSFAQNGVAVVPLVADSARASHAIATNNLTVTSNATVLSVSVIAPRGGTIIVNSSALVIEPTAADDVWCSITQGGAVESPIQVYESPGGAVDLGQLAGTRGYNVTPGSHTFNLVCRHVGTSGSSIVSERALTAILVPPV